MGKPIFILLVLALIIRLFVAPWGYHVDVVNHMAWGVVAVHQGLFGIYDHVFNLPTGYQINQPPGTILIYAAMRFVYEGLAGILPNLTEQVVYPLLLKVPGMACDLALGFLIYTWAKKHVSERLALFAAACFLFNPVTIYNSAVWGQTDAVVNFFGLWAFYLLTIKKPAWAILSFAASLFIKASLIIFVPIFIVVFFKERLPLKQGIVGSLAALSVIFLVTLPFHTLSDITWFPYLYKNRIVYDNITTLTENAFNIWGLFYRVTPRTMADFFILGISPKHWGYLLAGITAIPMLYRLWKHYSEQTIFSSLVIMGFATYLFFIGMHERYLYPVFPAFSLLLAFRPKLLWLYTVTSFIHLTNLYYLWWFPEIMPVKEFLQNTLVIKSFITGLIVCFAVFLFQHFTYRPRKIAQQKT